jgi:hypothetical protein
MKIERGNLLRWKNACGGSEKDEEFSPLYVRLLN